MKCIDNAHPIVYKLRDLTHTRRDKTNVMVSDLIKKKKNYKEIPDKWSATHFTHFAIRFHLLFETRFKMLKKSCYLLIAVITCFPKTESSQMTYLKTVESFDTLKLLIGLKKFNTTSLCGQHVAEFLSDLGSEKYWASVSK